MGNCAPKSKLQPKTALKLHGSESCPIATRIRIALLYKSLPFEFVAVADAAKPPFLQSGSDTVTDSVESILKYIDSKFAGAPAAVEWGSETKTAAAAAAIGLQHRSMERHVAGMERWASDLVAGKVGNGGRGRRLGDWYGRLVDLMLEHAQMEERFLFPLLDRAADSNVCREATEEHGRDLPMMNGIKEDFKMLMAMEAGNSFYEEVLLNLTMRLKKFQDHYKDHFKEEEKNLLPFLEAAERRRREEGEQPWSQFEWAEKVIKLMEATHSPELFPFLMSGLSPGEAMQYIDLVCRCTHDDKKVAKILKSLIDWFEGTSPLSWIKNTPYLKA